jgi:hypothetical protein
MSKKKFDCVAMKRKVQEKIYNKTKDMTPDELLDYYVQRSKNNPFLKMSGKKSLGKNKKQDEAA